MGNDCPFLLRDLLASQELATMFGQDVVRLCFFLIVHAYWLVQNKVFFSPEHTDILNLSVLHVCIKLCWLVLMLRVMHACISSHCNKLIVCCCPNVDECPASVPGVTTELKSPQHIVAWLCSSCGNSTHVSILFMFIPATWEMSVVGICNS